MELPGLGFFEWSQWEGFFLGGATGVVFFAGGPARAGLFLWSCFGELGAGAGAVVLFFGWKLDGRKPDKRPSQKGAGGPAGKRRAYGPAERGGRERVRWVAGWL